MQDVTRAINRHITKALNAALGIKGAQTFSPWYVKEHRVVMHETIRTVFAQHMPSDQAERRTNAYLGGTSS